MLGQILAECIGIFLFLKSYFQLALKRSVVSRKRDKLRRKKSARSVKTVEVLVYKASRDLSCSVRTVVEEYNAVAFVDLSSRLAPFRDYGRQHKFVGNALVIAVLHCLDSIAFKYAFAVCDRSISLGYSLPYIVSVHCIESAAYSSYLAVSQLVKILGKLFDKALAADGRHVSAVHKTMDISILDAHILCHFDSGKKMLDVRVYAAVGKQSHYMQTFTVEFCIIHSVNKSRIGKEIAVLYRLAYLGQVLKDNSACADIEVSYLAVAHLTVGKSHRKSAGI